MTAPDDLPEVPPPPPKRVRVRHASKLTVDLAERILGHLRSGLFREPAAALCGIHPDTLRRWLREGRQDLDDAQDELERTGVRRKLTHQGQLLIDVQVAEAQTEAAMLGNVVAIANNGKDERAKFLASTWYLERKRNLVYGRGALRPELHQGEDDYDGSTADADAEAMLQSASRYAATRDSRTPTQ